MKTVTSFLSEPNKLQYIDCIRGIAILMVIITHADKYLTGLSKGLETFANYGQMGVQLFFIASAYTLCLSMDRRKNDETLKTFYVRRYFHIAPLYYLGIPLYLFYYSVLVPLAEGSSIGVPDWYTIPDVLANVFFIHDFVPGIANNRVVPGGWSIGTETTFYAIFPLLFLLYRKFGNQNNALVLIPFVSLAVSVLAVNLLNHLATDIIGYDNFSYFMENNRILYFNIICQLPVFLLGMSLYFKSLNFRKSTLIDRLYLLFAFLGFTFIALVVYVYYSDVISLLAFVPAISFFFLFLLFKEVPVLGNKLLARIGQLSYSIYLFHFIFAYEGSRLMNDQLSGYFSPDVRFFINVIFSTILSIGVAILSEKYIEKPGIEIGKKVIAKMKEKRHLKMASQTS